MKNILWAFLLTLAVAFAGCEPAGNSGNSGGSETPPPKPNPDATPPDTSNLMSADTGKWDIGAWQAAFDGGGWYGYGGAIGGATSLTAFCIWANQYFPDGIPANPGGGNWDWSKTEWDTYFEAYPDIKANFPGNWDEFLDWAKSYRFYDKDPDNYDYNIPPAPYVEGGVPEGQWELAKWQRYVDSQENGIPGITHLTNFIQWANTNFPEKIINVPDGQSGDPWDSGAWQRWFTSHTDQAWQKFAGNWDTFLAWAKTTYGDGDMPNTPPAAVNNPAAPNPAAPNTGTENTGNPLNDLIGTLTGGSAGNAANSSAANSAANSAASRTAKPAVLDGSSSDKSFADSGMIDVE